MAGETLLTKDTRDETCGLAVQKMMKSRRVACELSLATSLIRSDSLGFGQQCTCAIYSQLSQETEGLKEKKSGRVEENDLFDF